MVGALCAKVGALGHVQHIVWPVFGIDDCVRDVG